MKKLEPKDRLLQPRTSPLNGGCMGAILMTKHVEKEIYCSFLTAQDLISSMLLSGGRSATRDPGRDLKCSALVVRTSHLVQQVERVGKRLCHFRTAAPSLRRTTTWTSIPRNSIRDNAGTYYLYHDSHRRREIIRF